MASAVVSPERIAVSEAQAAAEALIASRRVTAATRAVLLERLAPRNAQPSPRFLDAEDFATLTFACARLLPADSPVRALDVAADIDDRFADGRGDGWRHDSLPPDGEACRRGLAALRRAAAGEGSGGFGSLPGARQDALLRAAAAGEPVADGFDGRCWFEDLLAEVSEAHVAHPATQLQMGCDAFADVPIDRRERLSPSSRSDAVDAPMATAAPARVALPRPIDPAAAQRHRDNDIVDAVVIGTGAGGGPMLWRLARAGLSVVGLEAGRHWNPARDFATDEKSQDKLFWTDERLSAGADPLAFGNNNSGLGVGGSTLHYTAYMPRPQPDDFRLHRDFGVGVDWPIGHADLEPYFDELEALIGVSGPATYPWGPARKTAYTMPPLPLNAPATLMQRACAELGIVTSPAANAALSRDRVWPGQSMRQACTNRGFCQAGCSTGAKGSVDIVFIPPALAHGAELRTGCFVTRIERDAAGRVSGVVYMHEGAEKRQRCRSVFLCAGGIESPRLLLMNDGLGNRSGQVGRNFMAHCGQQVWGFFDEPTKPWRGIPGGLISEDTHRPRGVDFAGGYLLQSIGVMPVTYASQLARSGRALFGRALGEHLGRFDHVAGINILGDCLPSPSNYLELSDELDARGLPKPRIHFSAGVNEQRMTAHADRTMRSIWRMAGAHDVWSFARFAHLIGTCRMGRESGKSVVDADCRVFDVPGLYVCDNSVFPSALSVNPSLTIMALALRTADRFLARVARPPRP